MNEAMKKNLENYRTALERIRANGDLHADARRRLVGEVYGEASRTHERLVGEDRARVGKAYDGAGRSVFGAPVPYGADGAERAAVQASYRDALFRVSEVGAEDADQLHRLQSMAAATGDKLLQRAVLYRGYELENPSVVEAVASSDPEIGRAWESFMDAAEELNAAEADPMRYVDPDAPAELDGHAPPAA